VTAIDFDAYAAEYGRSRSINPLVLQRLIERSGLQTGGAVLEVGCGTANYLRAIVEITGAVGYGVDPSAGMLEVARSGPGSAGLTLEQATAEHLPFDNARFDLVFSVDVMHHITDRAAAAREAFRVLKAGGVFVAATDSHEDIANRVPLASHFPETVPHELKRYPPIERVMRDLRAAGFDDVTTEHVTFTYDLTDLTPYRDRAFSALRLLTGDQFEAGLARLERELDHGPIPAQSLYSLVRATKPPK
jgi:SAM-dependent methyltransferase